MKNKISIALAMIILSGAVILNSCKKDDDDKLPPSISFKSGDQYTQNGDVVKVGRSLKFGIQARANDGNLTNLTVNKHLPNGTIIPVMDTGMNTGYLNIDKVFYQNIEDTALWVFSVLDRNRLSAQVSLTVYRDPQSSWGGIIHHTSVIMGYQGNLEYGHFLYPFTGKTYFEDSATILQENMDMLVYYIVDDNLPSPVFSSPGEMDNFSSEAMTFYPSIINWQTRRYTLWDISVDDDPIPLDAFQNAHNDSLLIVAYDEIWGKKKFKWATNDRIIPFQTHGGKRGLIRVINAEHAADGKIEFEIKIQI
ncbi:MAG: hypothetical protein KKA81_02795 [Bacteroidetes bacterium]|nr:hypothetical protein [Bacteroidota bacterium]